MVISRLPRTPPAIASIGSALLHAVGDEAIPGSRGSLPSCTHSRSRFLSNLPVLVLGTSSMNANASGSHHFGGSARVAERCGLALVKPRVDVTGGVREQLVVRFTRACVPAFRQRGYGRIVNVTSYTGLHGNFGQANYAAAKAGVIGFTKTAAKELARFGVTVNAISPNAHTAMTASMPPERFAEFEKATPLGRIADPAEIVDGVLFLASRAAGYITGAVLPIDGGMSM
jgi:NAD(P)-dependent dehydrogenase (short-subunit alcohol dehydrogenase family)